MREKPRDLGGSFRNLSTPRSPRPGGFSSPFLSPSQSNSLPSYRGREARSESRENERERTRSKSRSGKSRSYSVGRGDSRHLRERGPTFLVRPSDISAQEGENIHVYAKVDGNPPPHVKWTLNYGEIYNKSEFSDRLGDHWLTVREALKGGTITCSASNKVSKATTECKLTIDGMKRTNS